jgi:hypothetical protein
MYEAQCAKAGGRALLWVACGFGLLTAVGWREGGMYTSGAHIRRRRGGARARRRMRVRVHVDVVASTYPGHIYGNGTRYQRSLVITSTQSTPGGRESFAPPANHAKGASREQARDVLCQQGM